MNATDILQDLKQRFWGLADQEATWLRDRDESSEPEVTVETLEDLRRACSRYDQMQKGVPREDWKSPASLQLLALGSEVLCFQTAYEEAYGLSPDKEHGETGILELLAEFDLSVRRAISYLLAIGFIEDSGRRRLNPNTGHPEVIYVARRLPPRDRPLMRSATTSRMRYCTIDLEKWANGYLRPLVSRVAEHPAYQQRHAAA
jgi:hypothetical protein